MNLLQELSRQLLETINTNNNIREKESVFKDEKEYNTNRQKNHMKVGEQKNKLLKAI